MTTKRSMKVCVTGGAGFIGAWVVRDLLSRGYRVVVQDDLSAGGDPPEGARFILGDVRDANAVATAVADCDVVIHMAVLCVRLSYTRPLDVESVNARGTLIAALAAERIGARFCYVSSSEVYGDVRDVLDPDEDLTDLTPCNPTTVYGASKLAGEHYARAAVAPDRCVVVRPFNAYGPGSHVHGAAGEVIPRWIVAALTGRPLIVHGDGQQIRDFTFVADTAREIVDLALEPLPSPNGPVTWPILIGSNKGRTMLSVAQDILDTTGSQSAIQHGPARPGDLSRLVADVDPPSEAISWSAGLAQTIHWILAGLADGSIDPAKIPDHPWEDAK